MPLTFFYFFISASSFCFAYLCFPHRDIEICFYKKKSPKCIIDYECNSDLTSFKSYEAPIGKKKIRLVKQFGSLIFSFHLTRNWNKQENINIYHYRMMTVPGCLVARLGNMDVVVLAILTVGTCFKSTSPGNTTERIIATRISVGFTGTGDPTGWLGSLSFAGVGKLVWNAGNVLGRSCL